MSFEYDADAGREGGQGHRTVGGRRHKLARDGGRGPHGARQDIKDFVIDRPVKDGIVDKLAQVLGNRGAPPPPAAAAQPRPHARSGHRRVVLRSGHRTPCHTMPPMLSVPRGSVRATLTMWYEKSNMLNR